MIIAIILIYFLLAYAVAYLGAGAAGSVGSAGATTGATIGGTGTVTIGGSAVSATGLTAAVASSSLVLPGVTWSAGILASIGVTSIGSAIATIGALLAAVIIIGDAFFDTKIASRITAPVYRAAKTAGSKIKGALSKLNRDRRNSWRKNRVFWYAALGVAAIYIIGR